MTQCNHQKDINRNQGSWVEEKAGDRVRIICRYCGKFYGYKPTRKDKACNPRTSSGEQ